MDPVAIADPVQKPPNDQLRLCVLRPYPGHERAALLRREAVGHGLKLEVAVPPSNIRGIDEIGESHGPGKADVV